MRPSRMILFVALIPGCGDKPSPPSAPPVVAVNPSLPVPEARGPVEAAAKVFLRTVGQGTSSPKELSADFKKFIAPPALPSDQAQGYSDERAEAWLKALKIDASASSVTCPLATAEFGFAVAAAPKARTLLRFVKVGHEWLVDWCQNTAGDPLLPGNLSATDANEAGAWFAAAAFVESVGQGQLAAANDFLTKPAKAKLSPPLFDADSAQGFNRGNLDLELPRFVPAGSSIPHFHLEKTDGGYLGRGELKIGSATKALLIVLVRGTRPGEWNVGDFMVN